jgi:hypothetical protein
VVVADRDNQIIGLSNKRECDWQSEWYTWMIRKTSRGFCGTNVKRPTGKTRCIWENRIEKKFKEI